MILKLIAEKVSETWAALEGLPEIFEVKCAVMSDGERVRQTRSENGSISVVLPVAYWGRRAGCRFDMLNEEAEQPELDLECLRHTLLSKSDNRDRTVEDHSEFADMYERVVRARKVQHSQTAPINTTAKLPVRCAEHAEQKKRKSHFRKFMGDITRFKSPNLERQMLQTPRNGLPESSLQVQPEIFRDPIHTWMKDVHKDSLVSVHSWSTGHAITETPNDGDNASSSQSRDPTSAGTSGAPLTWTNQSSASRSSGKRRMIENTGDGKKDEDDDQDREEQKSRRQNNTRSSSGGRRRFACPYHKRNPERHQKYRSCAHPGFESVHRIK